MFHYSLHTLMNYYLLCYSLDVSFYNLISIVSKFYISVMKLYFYHILVSRS